MTRCSPVAAVLLGVCLAWSSPAQAQWFAEAQAGKSRSSFDLLESLSLIKVSTTNISLGARYERPAGALQMSVGLPANDQDSRWGSVAGWKSLRISSRAFLRSVDVTGNGFYLSRKNEEGATGARAFVGKVAPVLGYDGERFSVRARAGATYYGSWLGASGNHRTVGLAEAQMMFFPSAALAIVPTVRGYRASEGAYTYAGLTGVTKFRAVELSGSVGRWLGRESDRGVPWSATAAWQVSSRLELNSSYELHTVNPTYDSPRQSTWSVGFSFRVTGKARPVEVLPRFDTGRVAIRLPIGESSAVPRIAGDFNNWEPEPMEKSGEYWSRTFALEPGIYTFSFIDDKGVWFVPRDFPGRRDDEFGGHSAVVVVR